MGFQDYIGESEACAFAGVAPSTLRRFAEAGYFQIETDSDGLRLFSKSEIENLFGLKPMSGGRPRPSNPVVTPTPVMQSPPNSSPLSMTGAPASTAAPSFQTQRVDERAGASESFSAPRNAATVVRAPIEATERESGRTPPGSTAAPSSNLSSSSPLAAISGELSGDHRSPALESLEREVTKLQNIVTLQEKLLDVREEEIRNIRTERDWLRSRIEKLEEKNERDQLLLLAETQTVRQLINLQHRKRSTVQLALEWLGLKSAPPAPGQPIEISPSAPLNKTASESK